MHITTIFLVLPLAFGTCVLAANGPYFSTGGVGNGTFIREATATLVAPLGQQPLTGFLSLWVGMGTSNGDLIQTILDRHPGDGVAQTICETSRDPNQWCGYAYTLVGADGDQIFGDQVRVLAGNQWTSHYVYIDDENVYEQRAALNGAVLSTLKTSSGKAGGFGSAVECAATDCGDVPAHQWINVTVTMDGYDSNYGETLATFASNNTGFYSDDCGKTWKADSIWLNEWRFS